MIFYVFFETDGDFGKYRRSFGFRTEHERAQWVQEELHLLAERKGEFLSDLEEWESNDEKWNHIRVL